MIERASIEALLERARIEEVVGQFVELSTRGANRKGTCPFCDAQKKFSVSVPKQLYHCFSCAKGGASPLKFLQEARGMSFPDAAKWLADFYKMELRHEPKDATAASGTIDRSYFDQRMAEIGYRQDRPDTKGLFRPHSSGGVEIRFPELRAQDDDGNALPPWQHDGKEEFARVRLHPSRVTSSKKYEQPKDTGIHIFIPPRVVQLYREGKQCPELYIVEGEFKAFVMAEQGVPIVGITGIYMWQRARGKKELHPDIMELLRGLQCTTVVLVLDADCMQVRWDWRTEPDKDLSKRLRDFAGALTGFRMATGTLVQRVFLSHPREEFAEQGGKGLDDLAALKGAEEVAAQLQALGGRNSLFKHYDLSDATYKKINGIFHLSLYRGVPEDFYRTYQDLLGDRDWNFGGAVYAFDLDDEGGKLKMVRHQDSDLFVRVGCDYYRFVEDRDEHNNPLMRLVPWKETAINRDYVHKGFKNFFDTIQTFDAFSTVPGHHDEHQAYVETGTGRLYNRYKPLRTQPKKGSIDTIVRYLKHVFGEQLVRSVDQLGNVVAESPAWMAYMDYWTVMYRMPSQRLPAVALVSEEKKTGKSKLLELNCAIWEGNATMMGNDQLTDEFNGDWVSNQFVGVDETLLEKKHQQERMKRLITGTREQMRSMYKDREMTKLIVKFHFTSNNEDNFISIDDDEMRYWVVKVPPVPEGQRDPLLLEKMVAEIPALFHELRTRAIIHPRLDRLWFADSVIETEARKAVAANSKGWCEGEMRNWLEEEFYRIRWPELYFTIGQVVKRVNDIGGTKFRMKDMRRVLQHVWKLTPRMERIVVPFDPHRRRAEKRAGEEDQQRFYIFRACDFIAAEDAQRFLEEARAEWALLPDSIDGTGQSCPLPLYERHPQLEPA